MRLKLETDTKYSRVEDEEHKKKILSVFNGSFFSSLVGGGHSFFIFLRGPLYN